MEHQCLSDLSIRIMPIGIMGYDGIDRYKICYVAGTQTQEMDMKDFVLYIFLKSNFIELLFISIFLLTLPVTLYWKAKNALRKSSSRKGGTLRGTVFSVGAILIVIFNLWVAIVLGPDIIRHAQAVFGPTLLILFFAIAGSAILLSVSYTGRLLRTTWGGAHSESG